MSSSSTNALSQADQERQPLLNGGAVSSSSSNSNPSSGAGAVQAVRHHLSSEIRRDWTDAVLLLCYIITGLLDSASNSIWGSFVSMQTGNTVYIGLGLANPTESTRWIKSLVSLGSFCLGSFFFSRFHRVFTPRRRWVLCASFALQLVLCVAAASILTFHSSTSTVPSEHGSDLSWDVLVPIALVAFQSCGQAVTSRALQFNSLTSVVLTSIYTDLFGDANLFKFNNVERNRRVSAPLLLLIGAIGGGLLSQSPIGIASALWVAALLKLVIVLSWVFWPAEPKS